MRAPNELTARYIDVPVSAVESGWIETTFLPAVQREVGATIKHGGILWIVVDSHAEGNYLLLKVRHWAEEAKVPAAEIGVEEGNPLLLWHDIFGSPDRLGSAWSLADGGLLLMPHGSVLPETFLRERADALHRFCRTGRWSLCFLSSTRWQYGWKHRSDWAGVSRHRGLP